MANVDNLNFKVILDDTEFNTKVKRDIKLAQDLNTRLSNLLQIKARLTSLSAQDAASAKRQSDVLAKQAIDQERIKKAAAQTALEEEKVRTQAAKTAVEMQKITQAAANAALAQQRVATEAQRTAAATNQAALNAQRFRTETQRTATETQRTATATQNTANATARAELAQRRLRDYSSQTTTQVQSQSRLMNELKGYVLGYLSIHGATQLLSSLVRVTGEFELQKTTLAAMLGDLNKAEQVITRIQGLAVESPFQFKELTTYAKQLSAFSVPAEELFETTKMLADISAGLGVGMDRIVLAYGQVRSAAFLRGQEVRQFTEAGIPILDELAKQFSELEGRAVSTGEVFDKISARLVPFEMVAKVMKDLTSEGGKFYNMQEVQAETLRGKISNLKDAYEVMLNEIGEGQSENLKGAVDWTRRLIQNYEDTGRTLLELVSAYGIYRATLLLTMNLQSTFARNLVLLRQQFRKLTATLSLNPYAKLAVGVTAAIGVIYKLGKEMKSQSAISETLSKSQKEYADNLAESTTALDALYAKINLAKKGTKDYNTALSTIQRTYAPYIEQLRSEGVEVDNLATLYGELTKKIKESAQTRFVESARKDLDQTFAQELSDIIGGTGGREIYNLKRAMESMGLNEAEGVVLRMFLSGSATWEEISEKYGELAKKVEESYVSLGAGSSGPMKAKKYLDILKQSLTNLTNEYTTAIAVVDEFAIKMKGSPDPVVLVTGWRKIVQDTLTKIGLNKDHSFGLWATDTTQSTTYVEDMIKRYKELNEQIKLVKPFDDKTAKDLQQNKDAIEAVANALKIDIKNLAANDSDTWESKEERRIKRLIEALRKLQDHYEKLKALGVSDDSIKTLFEGLYPELIKENGKDFVTDLKYIERAIDLVEDLEKYAPEDAKKILVDLGGDEFSQYLSKLKEQIKGYKESAKAAGEYYNTLRKWATEDFNIDGEGITLDVSKIASDLNGKIREIELRATKAKELFAKIDVDSEEEVAKVKEIFVKEFGADAWNDFWASYQSDGIKAIENLADKEKEYEKKLAQEKVNDLAEKYVKESYFDNNIELTDLGDKNFFQLRGIRKKLQDLLTKEPLKIPVEIEQMLSKKGINTSDLTKLTLDDAFFKSLASEYGKTISDADMSVLRLVQSIQKAKLSTVDFGETIKKVIGGDLKNLTEEEADAFMSMVKSYMGDVQEMMSSVASYAEAIGDEELHGAVKGIAEAMDILGSMAERLAKGDWIGAIISGVTSLASTIMEAVSQEYALNDAIAQTRNEIALLNSQKRINAGVESIFGDDDYKKFQNAYDEVVSAHAKAIADLEKQNQQFHGRSKDNWGWGGTAGSLAAGAGLGAAIGSIFPVIGTAIGAGVGALVGMIVGLVGNAATEANDYAKSLQKMADEIGADLIDDSTGTFDVETLKSIKSTYSDLDKEYQQMLDNLITNAEIFENAVTEMATFMTDIFGQCADDMAASFIDAFKESGQAALEYGDIMSGLATDIAKSVIKSTILQNVFNEEDAKAAAVKLAQGDLGGSMAIIEEAMQAAQELSPNIQKMLESLKPYFNMGEMEGQSLGDGIKGITEDTANLLASYLNAIRADVSYARTIWERMDATTQRIASILAEFSAPSLMEYQAQIAANTYNTMIATQSILSKLDAVVTYSDGPAGVRVYS